MLYPLRESIRIAFTAMRANAFRSALTMLGVIIGVGSVTAIGAVGTSGRRFILSELETFGTRSVWVKRAASESPTRTERSGDAIVEADVERIRRLCDRVSRVSPLYGKWGLWAKYRGKFTRARLVAVDADYFQIGNEAMHSGRFLAPGDVRTRRKVCVIGTDTQRELFGAGVDPRGARIEFGLGKFEVIGVLEEKNRDFLASIGSLGGETANNRVVIPYTVFQAKYGIDDIAVLQAEAVSMEEADTAARQIESVLSSAHAGRYAYETETMKQYIATTNRVVGVAWWVASCAAIIALVVGGIGIMNIMTSSVMERIREIGVRKALGAKDRDILMQFLVEAVAISVTGGAIGLAIGAGTTLAVEFLSGRPVALSAEYLGLGLGISVLTGVASGAYPAYRAARMDPVYALRYE